MRDARLRRPHHGRGPGWTSAEREVYEGSKDERYTPGKLKAWVLRELRVRPFTLDVAACAESHLARRYYSKERSGLERPWDADSVWCNPPFTRPWDWTAHAWHEASMQRFRELVMLLPAMRQEQPGWQRDVESWRDRGQRRFGYTLTSHHPPGRWSFIAPGGVQLGPAGFPLVLLYWRRADVRIPRSLP